MTSHTRSLLTHLVEVSDAGDVVLAAPAQNCPRVGYDHSSVPQGSVQLVPLQDGRDHYHVVLPGQLTDTQTVNDMDVSGFKGRAGPDLLAEAGGDSVLGRLGKLGPRLLLSGAEGKGHCCRQT